MAQSTPAPQQGEGFLEGKLLIAMPGMADPRFEKSVIFMCEHSSDSAMGLIINKPIAGLSFHDLMAKFEIDVIPGSAETPILFGGPVQMGRGFVLHTADYTNPQTTLSLTDKFSLTASIDVLRAIAQGHGPKKSILALGYAGWGVGQIESEIMANGWIHCDADEKLVFDTNYNAKWTTALAKLGADISGLSAEAGRA